MKIEFPLFKERFKESFVHFISILVSGVVVVYAAAVCPSTKFQLVKIKEICIQNIYSDTRVLARSKVHVK